MLNNMNDKFKIGRKIEDFFAVLIPIIILIILWVNKTPVSHLSFFLFMVVISIVMFFVFRK